MSASLWIVFLANFVFWTGLSAGAVAFAALLDLTGARWAGPVRAVAWRFHRFLPLSVVLYLLLLVGARTIYPWVDHPIGSSWLRFGLFASRDTAALVALAVAAAACFTSVRPPTRATVLFLVVYVIGFSVLAIDLVMSLEAPWGSTLFPAYLLTTNVYGAIAASAIVAAGRVGGDERVITDARACDLGKLLFGFALLWMYLVWSQFLVVWYGNLSEEVGYVIIRASGRWLPLAIAVWCARFAVPFVVLLSRAGKRPRPMLAAAAVSVAGFWAECFLLVTPSTPNVPTMTATALVTIVFIVLFAASIAPRLRMA